MYTNFKPQYSKKFEIKPILTKNKKKTGMVLQRSPQFYL